MFKRLDTRSLNIAELLSDDRRFRIPEYQRPYAWRQVEIDQLFDDLVAAAGLDGNETAESDYFLGAMILQRDAGPSATEVTDAIDDVVDGQQRLVTLTLLFSVLRDTEPGSTLADKAQALIFASKPTAKASEPRLRLRGSDQTFLHNHVLAVGASKVIPVSRDHLPAPHQSIIVARDRLAELLAQRTHEEREALFNYVCNQCHVVAIVTDDLDQGHKLFAVINDTGMPLQRNQILKAEVLRACPPEDTEQVAQVWNETEATLDRKFDDVFAHIRTAHGITRGKIIDSTRALVEKVGGPKAFVLDTLAPFAATYVEILNVGDPRQSRLSPEILQALDKMNRMSGEEWMPAAMLALRHAATNPNEALRALHEIDRLAHALRLLCVGGHKRQARFLKVCAAMRSGQAYSSERHPAFQLTNGELRSIAHHLKDLHARNPQACKLVLMRLSDKIASDGPLRDGRALRVPTDYTVEHVLPQRPSPTSAWRIAFSDSEERQVCTASLGNLVLLTPQQNLRAKNEEFEVKKHAYATADSGQVVPAITRQAMMALAWTPQVVLARQADLLARIADLWQLDLPGVPRYPQAPQTALRQPTGTQ